MMSIDHLWVFFGGTEGILGRVVLFLSLGSMGIFWIEFL
jgi:hypothetical protein